MAGQAESLRRRGNQLDAGDVFIDANLMATRAAHLDGGMDGLALGLVLVAFQAGLGIGVRFERNWVDRTEEARRTDR